MMTNKISNEALAEVIFKWTKDHNVPLQEATIVLLTAMVYLLHAEDTGLETEMLITTPCCGDSYQIKLEAKLVTDAEREKIKEKIIESRLVNMPTSERKH